MYHPGKVIKLIRAKEPDVISSDGATQAMLRMWDENLLTLFVDPKLAMRIKEGDTVLVDYRPLPDMRVPVPRQVVSKVIKGAKAEAVWKEYQLVFERIRRSQQAAAHQAAQQQAYIQ
jgi:hypothetical protein